MAPSQVARLTGRSPRRNAATNGYVAKLSYTHGAGWDRTRLTSVGLTLAIHMALLLAVISAFAPQLGLVQKATPDLTAFQLTPPPDQPKPPPPPPQHQTAKAASGRAAPANKKSLASPVFAPKLPPLIKPPPIAAAPTPATGALSESGASDRAGPGTGAGGTGNGLGAGDGGDGTGGGGSPPDWIGGRISDSDYPQAARASHAQGKTVARVAIDAIGRVSACSVAHSSGNESLDVTTCALIIKRFRFRAARDRSGRSVASVINYVQDWLQTGQWDGKGGDGKGGDGDQKP